MDRLESLRQWFRSAPMAEKFPMTLGRITNGKVIVSLAVEQGHLVEGDSAFMVQGGIIAVVADAAAVMAAMSVLEHGHTPLANLHMDFLAPTAPDDRCLTAVAKVVGETSRIVWVEVKVFGGKGDLKAFATATFAKPKANPAAVAPERKDA